MEKYPTGGSGDLVLKKTNQGNPIDCMRVMLEKTRQCKHVKISGPGDVLKLMQEMGDYERERAMIIHLDTKNNVIGIENISTGSLSSTIVHPREAVKGAILNSAAHIIFVHNHPSGDTQPSREDLQIQAKLVSAFDIVGIDMLDSIIIGGNSYYSAKEYGALPIRFSGESSVMENREIEESGACSTAVEAAMSVINERCGNDDEPEQGKFFRLHLKQELKTVHALATGTMTGGHTAEEYAENVIRQIESGHDHDLITENYAEKLKTAVQKALSRKPYMDVMCGI